MMNICEIQDFLSSNKHPETFSTGKKRILDLLEEVSKVYKETMNRNVDGLCDICGKGNTSDIYKLKDIVPGYKRRPSKSPRLCYNHFCGWNMTLSKHQFDTVYKRCHEAGDDTNKISYYITKKEMESKYGLTDEEVDLHFATYLSKQLLKEAKLYKNKETQ
jgi:hypothetical protein